MMPAPEWCCQDSCCVIIALLPLSSSAAHTQELLELASHVAQAYAAPAQSSCSGTATPFKALRTSR